MCLLAFLWVLLLRSEVAKTFIADSFANGSKASRRGTTRNSHQLQVRVERVVRVASLLDNPFIHGNPNMSSCFRCTVGYPSFKIQTIISVIYSPKDFFLLSIKCWFDGSKTSRQTSPLQPTTFNLINTISTGNVLFSPKHEKLLLQTFLYISGMVWGDLKKRRF